MDSYVLYFNSSSGGAYGLTVWHKDAVVQVVMCGCPAGHMNQLCKHVKALFSCDLSMLHRPDQHKPFQDIYIMLQRSPLATEYAQLQAALTHSTSSEYSEKIKKSFIRRTRSEYNHQTISDLPPATVPSPDITNNRNSVALAVGLVVFVIAAVGGGVALRSGSFAFPNVPTVDPAASPSACKLPEPECKYLGGAGGYLKTTHDQAQKMAGVFVTGDSTMGDIKRAIEKAQSVEKAGFFGDYSKNPVPSGYADLDKKITRVHQMHDDVFNRFLKDFDKMNPRRIDAAFADYKKTLEFTGRTVRDFTKLMDEKLKQAEAKQNH